MLEETNRGQFMTNVRTDQSWTIHDER